MGICPFHTGKLGPRQEVPPHPTPSLLQLGPKAGTCLLTFLTPYSPSSLSVHPSSTGVGPLLDFLPPKALPWAGYIGFLLLAAQPGSARNCNSSFPGLGSPLCSTVPSPTQLAESGRASSPHLLALSPSWPAPVHLGGGSPGLGVSATVCCPALGCGQEEKQGRRCP